MTETTITAIVVAVVAALPPTCVAWLAFREARENSKKSSDITGKVNEVHVLANNNLAKVSAALDVANTKIEGLEKLLAALVPPKRRH